MKKATSRRLFLRTAGITAAAITTMPSVFAVNNFSNLSKSANPSHENASMDINHSKQVHEQILIYGVIFDKFSKSPIKNAELKVWHHSDEPGKLGSQYRITTDDNGLYKFATKRPRKVKGKSPRINFNLSKPDGSYNTELIVTDFGAFITDNHWVLNQQLGEQVFPQQTNYESHTEFQFNLSI